MKLLNDTTRNQVVLGILSGMRTNAGLLTTSILIRQQAGSYFSPSGLVRFFNNRNTPLGLSVSSAAEIVVDKLPNTPDRIEAGGLTGRVISGAVAGATISSAAGKKPVEGMVIGSTAAIASTFFFFFLRKNIGLKSRIPDPVIGAAEDVLAFTIGFLLIRSNKPKSPRII